MSTASQARTQLASMIQQHCGIAVLPEELQAVSAGASGRSIMRAAGVLGIHWTDQRADNHSFLPAAHGLARAGIRVPAILAEATLPENCGACLVQDLGETDILSLREAPWAERHAAYEQAFRTLLPFYQLKPEWPLQPPFDAALYRWEQEYFAEHLIGRHLGADAAAFLAQPELQAMADWLAGLPRVPVHRDCQSQNIMLHGGKAWLIDFQGMRYGRLEYDLASLLYDPYMQLGEAERNELLQLWEQMSGTRIDSGIYAACAMQRLMQALGAFANIGYNQQRDWYLNLIPTGLAALRHAAAHTPKTSPAAPVAACLLQLLNT
ncbi:MAG: phosphotransferase [Akkermansia sp.]|nr:phosphotransferase [Akkermansia sp.]